MEVIFNNIKVRDLVTNYADLGEHGVKGYHGKLDIRPAYQREFVYKDKQREAVINSINNGYPLNTMYWVDNGNNNYEVLDGQQRTISICQYINGDFSVDKMYFHNLDEDAKAAILDYELLVYFCKGSNKDKLGWFTTINIAGEKLTAQELRNSVYSGTWLNDARNHFSKTGCPAYNMGKHLVKGSPIRQEFLETAIKWISGGDIEGYMAANAGNMNASELWEYFQNVVTWVDETFTNYRKEMKGIAWGGLYDTYKDTDLDAEAFEQRISELMQDEDVTKKAGVYTYLLDGNEKHLSVRAFSPAQRREVYERQNGICPVDGEHYAIDEMHADHIVAWSKGGKTSVDNCEMLSAAANLAKSDK